MDGFKRVGCLHGGEEVLEGFGGAEPAYPLKTVKPETFELRRAG